MASLYAKKGEKRLRVGLIDVDGHNFPSLPLMKLSAWHKSQNDSVEWYRPTLSGHMDKVYMSKVFSFTSDYPYFIDADEIEKGGTGYAISLDENGKEHFDSNKNKNLPDEIEHIYPDYSLYNINDTAYGFLTRGCPRNCGFCHVSNKEGCVSHKVANIEEFWKGQKELVLLDPNILACKESVELLEQIKDTKTKVDFTQGLDIRMMTQKKSDLLKQMKIKRIHFAWDQAEDDLTERFEMYADGMPKSRAREISVYVLCGYNTTIEQDLNRIYSLRKLNYSPYVMIYNKDNYPKGHPLRKLQRWVNNRYVFWSCETFEDYQKKEK